MSDDPRLRDPLFYLLQGINLDLSSKVSRAVTKLLIKRQESENLTAFKTGFQPIILFQLHFHLYFQYFVLPVSELFGGPAEKIKLFFCFPTVSIGFPFLSPLKSNPICFPVPKFVSAVLPPFPFFFKIYALKIHF